MALDNHNWLNKCYKCVNDTTHVTRVCLDGSTNIFKKYTSKAIFAKVENFRITGLRVKFTPPTKKHQQKKQSVVTKSKSLLCVKNHYQINFMEMTTISLTAYNHATSNLAIYSHETSEDKLSEA